MRYFIVLRMKRRREVEMGIKRGGTHKFTSISSTCDASSSWSTETRHTTKKVRSERKRVRDVRRRQVGDYWILCTFFCYQQHNNLKLNHKKLGKHVKNVLSDWINRLTHSTWRPPQSLSFVVISSKKQIKILIVDSVVEKRDGEERKILVRIKIQIHRAWKLDLDMSYIKIGKFRTEKSLLART